MGPDILALFRAIAEKNSSALQQSLRFHSHAPWFLNEDNQSAFELILKSNHEASINITLERLSQNISSTPDAHFAKWTFSYALLKTVNHFCSSFTTTQEYIDFYHSPSKKFTFKNLDHEKSTIQSYIRTKLITSQLSKLLTEHKKIPVSEILPVLLNHFSSCIQEPFFSEHRTTFGWMSQKPTDTLNKFTELQAALNILINNRTNLPTALTLDDAQKILLLCAKCYPFSSNDDTQSTLQQYWSQIASQIFTAFKFDKHATKALFDKLLDKTWLFTEDDIPLTKKHLLCSLEPATVFYGSTLPHGSLFHDIPLNEDGRILALYQHPKVPKRVTWSKTYSPENLRFLHCILMNNTKISLIFANDESFENPILKFFPQSSCFLSLFINSETQLTLMRSTLFDELRVRTRVECAISSNLLHTLSTTELASFQRILNMNQSMTVQVVKDAHLHPAVEADMVISHNNLTRGPHMFANSAQAPLQFYALYEKFPWKSCFGVNAVQSQIFIIAQAMQRDEPLFFNIDEQNFDKSIFEEIQTLLNQKKYEHSSCFIRVDNMQAKRTHEQPINTLCDFRVTRTDVHPGPLRAGNMCQKPNLYDECSHVKKLIKTETLLTEEELQALSNALKRSSTLFDINCLKTYRPS